jgi:hypothetical protein
MFVKQDALTATMNLKNLKSLFIVTDETEKTKEDTNEETSTPATQPKTTSTPATTTVVSPNNTDSGNFEDRIAESLFAALEKNNLDGFDYFEFKNALKALATLPLDEATRFHSAFATSATMGLTVEKLLESADYYLKVLGNEHNTFMGTVAAQRNANVHNKEADAEALNKTILEKSEQIKQLTQQIQQHQAEIQQMREDMAQAKARIEQTEANFNRTYTSVVTQMTDDIDNIKKYLVK